MLAAPLVAQAAAVPPATAKPGVVVAAIDTGINPYHGLFHAGSRIYPASNPPTAVTLPVLKSFGIDARPDCWIELTRTGKPDAATATTTAMVLPTAATTARPRPIRIRLMPTATVPAMSATT